MPPYALSPHKAADVFSTDTIRVLRAARFAAAFGLALDPHVTRSEICKHAHRCKFDSPGALCCACACAGVRVAHARALKLALPPPPRARAHVHAETPPHPHPPTPPHPFRACSRCIQAATGARSTWATAACTRSCSSWARPRSAARSGQAPCRTAFRSPRSWACCRPCFRRWQRIRPCAGGRLGGGGARGGGRVRGRARGCGWGAPAHVLRAHTSACKRKGAHRLARPRATRPHPPLSAPHALPAIAGRPRPRVPHARAGSQRAGQPARQQPRGAAAGCAGQPVGRSHCHGAARRGGCCVGGAA